MSIDDVIKHAEEMANEKEEAGKAWEQCKASGTAEWLRFSVTDIDSSILQCKKCAAECRQLAEWLKDYKRLLRTEKSGLWIRSIIL